MEKIEALEVFLAKEAKAASSNFVIRSLDYLNKENKADQVQAFVRDFQLLLQKCTVQKEGTVRYLQISLVRSKALCNQPFYVLEALKKDFYLSEPIVRQELDLDWLYQEFYHFCTELNRQSRKYILKVDELDLDYIKLAELDNCTRIVRHLFEESLVYLMNTDEFRELCACGPIQINISEYRGTFEKVFESDEFTEKLGRWWYGLL